MMSNSLSNSFLIEQYREASGCCQSATLSACSSMNTWVTVRLYLLTTSPPVAVVDWVLRFDVLLTLLHASILAWTCCVRLAFAAARAALTCMELWTAAKCATNAPALVCYKIVCELPCNQTSGRAHLCFSLRNCVLLPLNVADQL